MPVGEAHTLCGKLITTAVSSGIANSVLKYDGDSGAYLGEFVSANANGIVRPKDLLVHNGFLYISAWSGDVHRYNVSSGSFVNKFVTGLVTPVGIDFGPDGHFYVAEYAEFGNNAIYRYDGVTGNYLGEFVPDGAGLLNRPAGIEFGPDGNLYVVSGLNGDNRVLRFDGSTGAYLNDFVSLGLGGINGSTRMGCHCVSPLGYKSISRASCRRS